MAVVLAAALLVLLLVVACLSICLFLDSDGEGNTYWAEVEDSGREGNEKAVEEARLNDDPIPPLSSVFDPSRPAPSLEQLDLPKKMERQMKTPLSELPPHERELAVRAVLQEARMAHLFKEDFQTYAFEMNEKRKERQQWLIKKFGEPIGKFIIPDPPREPTVQPYRMEDLERKTWTHNGSGSRAESKTNQNPSEVP